MTLGYPTCLFPFSFLFAPARDCDPAFGLSCGPLAGRNGVLEFNVLLLDIFFQSYLTKHMLQDSQCVIR